VGTLNPRSRDTLLKRVAPLINALGVRFNDPFGSGRSFWTLKAPGSEQRYIVGATGPTSSPIPPWSTAFYPLIRGRDDFDLSLSSDLIGYGEQRFFP
jgi:hypothetical protein